MSRTVLICDDAMFMRTVIAKALTGAGFAVAGQAQTGAEAVSMYQELHPDLVTMDMVMPDVSGIDAVRQIVAVDPDACILVCSAMGQQSQVNQAIEAGASGFLVKPFDSRQLVAAAGEALAKRASRSA